MILLINRFVDPIVKALGENFVWLSELTLGSVLIRLLLIVLFSGIIGLERAAKRHEAGLRTYILVSLGSGVAMITNQFIYESFHGDAGRIAAQVVSGIGFLGAGTILITSRSQIKGLTTAAGLWACACMGIATGAGCYTLSIIGFTLIILVIFILPPFEKKLTKYSNTFRLHIELEARTNLKDLITYARQNEMKIQTIERNPAYANSGLSVYTVYLKRISKKKVKHIDIINEIKALPYVNFVDDLD